MHLMLFCVGLMVGAYGPALIARLLCIGERPHRMTLDEILATIPRQGENQPAQKP